MQQPPDKNDASFRQKRRRKKRLALAAALPAGVLVAAALLVALYTLTLIPELPRLRDVTDPNIERPTILYTADGQELTRFYRQNRRWVALNDISPHVVDALIATEDRRFYDHRGVDVRRLFSSALWTAGGNRQGGSTLTMQLARNLYPDVRNDATLRRKLKEMMTAFKIERHYSKQEILEMYLNTVPFGYNAFGMEAAAQTYFNKSAARLDAPESALLVGMLKGTTRYNPVRNPELALERRNVVLSQMARYGSLSEGVAQALRREPLDLDFRTETQVSGLAPHFAEHVRNWLGEWAEQHGYDLYADGLRVYTTLDAPLQAAAQAVVARRMEGLQAVVDYEWSRPSGYFLGAETEPYLSARRTGSFTPFGHFWNTRTPLVAEYVRAAPRYRHLERSGVPRQEAFRRLREDAAFMDSLRSAKTRLEAGLVAIDPNTGHVKAWVGGRDFSRDQYDKVALARRQPGSTFKPFVYAAAIDFGFSPFYELRDEEVTYEIDGPNRTWTPSNAGGYASGRTVTLREGLVQSMNTVTAQVMNEIGPRQAANYARRLGIRSKLDPVPSLALGTSEVTLLEMTSAYATLAAQGVHREPVVVTRIESHDGRLLAAFDGGAEKVISMYTGYTVVDMMRGVIDEGTGGRIRSRFGIEADVAGKTGTTQNSADGWFILMHPRLVTGAWVGFNDRRLTFRSGYWGQGAHNALPLVGDFFRRVLEEGRAARSDERFRPPPGYREPEPPGFQDSLYYAADPLFEDSVDAGDPLQLQDPALQNAYEETAPEHPRGDETELLLEADLEKALRREMQAGRANPAPEKSRSRPAAAPEADAERALRDRLPLRNVSADTLAPARPAASPADAPETLRPAERP